MSEHITGDESWVSSYNIVGKQELSPQFLTPEKCSQEHAHHFLQNHRFVQHNFIAQYSTVTL